MDREAKLILSWVIMYYVLLLEDFFTFIIKQAKSGKIVQAAAMPMAKKSINFAF